MLLISALFKGKKLASFPFFRQPDAKDCGPTCLRMILKHYGKDTTISYLRDISETTREGSSAENLLRAAESLGFEAIVVKMDCEALRTDAPLPAILHWDSNHFVVIYKIERNRFYIADPSSGRLVLTRKEFVNHWAGGQTGSDPEGIAILLHPQEDFLTAVKLDENSSQSSWDLFRYVQPYRGLFLQLGIGLFASSLLAVVFPFLTQSIVDIGIPRQNMGFVYMVLIAQIVLFVSRMSVEIIRGWILLHLSTRLNISLISDFFLKLTRLPIGFFDRKLTGDILQRIADHSRIEKLLTTSTLDTLFSMVTLLVYCGVLAVYDYRLLMIYLVGATAYILWVIMFLHRRKVLDHQYFSEVSKEQSRVIELVNGMQDAKMFNAERSKIWQWERIQVSLFRLKAQSLKIEQSQATGGNIINQVKDIFITFFCAKLVIDGDITLGAMVAVQFIIGQINYPLSQLVEFIRQLQDARISWERLREIQLMEDEEKGSGPHSQVKGDIVLDHVSFRYRGSSDFVLKDLSLTLPHQQTTAIVGASGSGKTTLLKLLLKFYEPSEGTISVGGMPLHHISHKSWRSVCGAVLQDGFIFNDTVSGNIALGVEKPSQASLTAALRIASLEEVVQELPQGTATMIGSEGLKLSGGQQQRVLIARAIYSTPEFLFFDEATSALDANTERKIIENLTEFISGRTAVIIAHRLSTVKNADNIIVLDHGQVVEQGDHQELISRRGVYYRLIKNQLELGT